jgi:small-conductance mechanosensitive channel
VRPGIADTVQPVIAQPLTAQPDCTREAGSWCSRIYRFTHDDMLARYADAVVGTGLRILLIFTLAVLIRLLVHRTITRLTRVTAEGPPPGLLRPLRERAPESWRGSEVLSSRRSQRARTIGSVLRSGTTFVVYGVACTLVLGELGINLGPIIASAGILGIALGFGAQNLVKDFLSGIFMMVEDQYGVGDVVDVGEASGTVESVGLRITTLRDVKGTVWYVRNGEVLRVGNSSQGFAVALVDVPLGYTADVERAAAVLAAAASTATESDALKDNILEPPEMLGVESVTPEGLQLRLTVKVRPGKQWAVQRALRAQLLAALEEAGFDPPLGRLFPPAAPAGGK